MKRVYEIFFWFSFFHTEAYKNIEGLTFRKKYVTTKCLYNLDYGFKIEYKLDGVGPVDNTPSTN